MYTKARAGKGTPKFQGGLGCRLRVEQQCGKPCDFSELED